MQKYKFKKYNIKYEMLDKQNIFIIGSSMVAKALESDGFGIKMSEHYANIFFYGFSGYNTRQFL